MENQDLDSVKQLEKAIIELKDHYLFHMNSSLSKTIFYSLVRGLSFGLGSVIGATLLVYILILFLSQIEFIPIIGEWAVTLIEQIEKDQ